MMQFFAHSWVLAVKELRVILRDRQALLLLFLMPSAFILTLSFALKDVFNEKVGGSLPIVVESHDTGALASLVMERLSATRGISIVRRDAGVSSSALFAGGTAKVVLRLPAGFSDELQAFIGRRGRGDLGLHRIVWEADPALDASYRWLVQANVALAVQQTVLTRLAGRTPQITEPESAMDREADLSSFMTEVPRAPGSRVIPTPLQQTVPGWSLFAMFFIALPLSGGFIRERQDGTLSRLATYPVSRGAIVLGKLAPYVMVNAIQFALMLVVGFCLAPALGERWLQLGSHPYHLVPVTIAAALAATGYGVLIASTSRTAEQASALGATSIIIMAVVGGIMVPSFLMPLFMRKVALLSPLYWGHQAYLDVFLREAPFTTIAPKLVALLVFSAVCLAIASRRLRAV